MAKLLWEESLSNYQFRITTASFTEWNGNITIKVGHIMIKLWYCNKICSVDCVLSAAFTSYRS